MPKDCKAQHLRTEIIPSKKHYNNHLEELKSYFLAKNPHKCENIMEQAYELTLAIQNFDSLKEEFLYKSHIKCCFCFHGRFYFYENTWVFAEDTRWIAKISANINAAIVGEEYELDNKSYKIMAKMGLQRLKIVYNTLTNEYDAQTYKELYQVLNKEYHTLRH